MPTRRYGYGEEPPGSPPRFNVICGSVIYGNVAIAREVTDEGTPVAVLTHRKGDVWKVREDAITKIVPRSPGVPA